MLWNSIPFILITAWGALSALIGAYVGVIPGIICAVLGPAIAWSIRMETNQEIERIKNSSGSDI